MVVQDEALGALVPISSLEVVQTSVLLFLGPFLSDVGPAEALGNASASIAGSFVLALVLVPVL